ncbi:MAG: sensor histidine kinase, partial [Kiloniellaceae bacterium]
TQDRIHALSMVHSNLYETPELHQIKLQEFVPQLCEYLRQAQGDAAESVRMTFDIDAIQSDPERAVPLALLITEVVTNALKHGWPEGEPGLLAVALKQVGEDGLEMTITDDGSTAESASPESLGGRLIHAFAKQLGGSVTIENGNGFHLTLQVPSSAASPSLS